MDIDECTSSPCNNNATCIDQVHSYTCLCNVGFSGSHCEVDVDECGANYCSNGSTCIDDVNGYSCKCAPGFSGDDCSTEIDECASFPCDYGGTCYDQVLHDTLYDLVPLSYTYTNSIRSPDTASYNTHKNNIVYVVNSQFFSPRKDVPRG